MGKNNYEDWTREELIKEVKSLKKQKTYGLVWEEDKTKEDFDYYINWDGKDTKETFGEEGKFPVLQEVKTKSIDNQDPKYNIMIEGDNYHALAVLNFTHNKAIDVIYIDPPYNRGGDFKYNDKIVDKEDSYRHSKWLSFMSKRLKLAKEVLSKDGVLFVSIDDTEFAQLKILCDELFGEDNVGIMVWRKSGDGRDGKMKNTTTYRIDHEYVIVCFKKNKILNKILEKPNFKGKLENPDNDSKGDWLSGSISRKESASNPKHKNYYEVTSPSGKKHKRQWDIPKEDFIKLNKEGRIYWGANGGNVPRIKIFESEERSITPYSILLNHGTTTEGTKEVNEILNGDYSGMRPKPTSLVQTLIQLSSKKNSVILDFFAGTGTTAHAVFKQNKKDGGKRKVIICTNDEDRIATNVCYPRIKKATQEYKDNFKYFKTDFVDSTPTDQNKKKIVDKSTEMLCIKENAFKLVKEKEGYKIFKNNDIYLGIIFDEDSIDNFIKDAKEIDGKFNVYVFSLDDGVPEREFRSMKGKVKLCPIPEAILHVYRRIFK
jgi:adenine-specific DNA-methyltransferase